jgi:hypothetical protein
MRKGWRSCNFGIDGLLLFTLTILESLHLDMRRYILCSGLWAYQSRGSSVVDSSPATGGITVSNRRR